jgi:poly(3-hydroxybutyrate) depolymerase
VFHGSADATVRPVNGERIIEGLADGPEQTGSAGGRRFSRRVFRGGRAELWMIEGAGHAWSGGKPPGSFTDPSGPDASAEMVHFFLA